MYSKLEAVHITKLRLVLLDGCIDIFEDFLMTCGIATDFYGDAFDSACHECSPPSRHEKSTSRKG